MKRGARLDRAMKIRKYWEETGTVPEWFKNKNGKPI
jgi:hypothetical protein